VLLAESFGHEHAHGLSDQLLAGGAEDPFGLAVHEHDPLGRVKEDKGVRGGLDQAAKAGLAASKLLDRFALLDLELLLAQKVLAEHAERGREEADLVRASAARDLEVGVSGNEAAHGGDQCLEGTPDRVPDPELREEEA